MRPRSQPPGPWIDPRLSTAWCRPTDLDFRLPRALLFARGAAVQRLLPCLRERALTEAQWRLLRVLEAAERPLGATEVIRRGEVDRGNIYAMVRTLSGRGCVAWRATPDAAGRSNRPDPRSGPWLALAPAGRDLIWRVRRGLRARFDDIAPRFGARAQARLDAALADLVRAVGQTLPAPLPLPEVFPSHDDPYGWSAQAIHDLDLGLPLTLLRARKILLARIRPLLMHHYLTEPQWRCLRQFAEFQNAITRRAASRAGGFHPGDGYRPIDMLLERGLIEYDIVSRYRGRGRYKQRKRFKLLLSRSGRRMIERVEADELRFLADVREQVGAPDVRLLQDLLQRYTSAVLWTPDAADGEPPWHPLDKVYAAEDARNYAAVVRQNARRREEKRAARA